MLNWFKTQIGKADQVVEEWHEGSSFYRKYSSGFIEQGGVENITSSASQSGTDNQTVITFHAPFSDENYCLLLTVHSLATNNAVDAIPTIWEQGLASATIKVYDYNVNALKSSWFACGY